MDRLLAEAIRLHRSGRQAEAAQLCDRIRQQVPHHLAALLLSGTIALQAGRYDAADQLFQLAQRIAPHSVDAATGRANALRALGKLDQALAVLEAALRDSPDHAIAWNNRGNLLLEMGQTPRAIESYDRAIFLQPAYPDALHNRGVARMTRGDNVAAEADFTRVLELKPDQIQALVNRGTARVRQGESRAEEAADDLRKAVSRDGANADAWHMLGRCYLMLRRHEDALSSWSAALRCQPNHAASLHDRGLLLNSLGRHPDAAADFEQLILVDGRDAVAWQGRGIALARLNHNEEAIASFSQALRYKPDDVLSLYNRAAVASVLKRYHDAAADLQSLIALSSEFPLARGLLVNARLHLCDWADIDQQRQEIEALLHGGIRVVHPFTNLLISDRPESHLNCACLQIAATCPAASPLYRREQYSHDKIRVAYLSGDFYQHAVPSLLVGVLESHDRGRLEVVGVSYGDNDNSPMRARIERACTQFFDVRERDDFSIAMLLRDLEIDIGIDLKGHAGGARPGILAHRPCPVQVNYLGYPGTMGAEYIDYIIADRIVIPPEHRAYYSEQVVYLPDTYQANDRARPIAPERISRRDAGLPDSAFVFCCFNGSQKILPPVFDSWMRILSRSGDSVLWLLEDNPGATANLRREAQARGISKDRLIFAQHEKSDRHLARLRLADVVLDTLPYGAHTTASDALWAGIPVLTRIGSSFASRVAASLLTAVGLPELITQSATEYETMAQNLAASPGMLRTIREKLARNRENCALFDSVRMTRNLEAAYEQMWQRHQRGEAPTSFAVP